MPHLALPVPSNVKPRVSVPEDHALWGFFRDRQTMTPPEDDAKHGRSWVAEELRNKSFDDLWALWIICLKERNIIATQKHERARQKIVSDGAKEARQRDGTVRRTMAGIKFVLSERLGAYEKALELAKKDDTITLTAEPESEIKKPARTPRKPKEGAKQPKVLAETQSKKSPRPRTKKTVNMSMVKKANTRFKIKAAELARANHMAAAATVQTSSVRA